MAKKYFKVKCSGDEVLVVDARNEKDAWKKAFKHFYNVKHSHCSIKQKNPKDYKNR